MTSKEKYTSALDKICVRMLCWGECSVGEGKCVLFKTIEEAISKAVKYDELTHQPTLSECIKEWEDRGWEVYVGNREIELLETNSLNTISIDKRDKCYWCNYYLSFELHHLLSKTLKALEVEDEKKD